MFMFEFELKNLIFSNLNSDFMDVQFVKLVNLKNSIKIN